MSGMQVGGGILLGIGEMSVQLMGKTGKDFWPKFLETFDGRSCNDGSRERIPIFLNPY